MHRRSADRPATARRRGAGWRGAVLSVAAVTACSPALNWREFRVGDLPLTVSMPCRPARQARDVSLGGRRAPMTLYACQAAERTFAIATLDAGDPARVGDELAALASAAVANVQGRIETESAAHVPGMTPHPSARRLAIVGRSPEGRTLRSQVVVFSFGTHVVQATVLGSDAEADVERAFFDGIKVVQ